MTSKSGSMAMIHSMNFNASSAKKHSCSLSTGAVDMKSVILLVLVSGIAQAGTYANWGMAVDYPGDGTYSDVQNYALGIQKPKSPRWDEALEIGGWKDQGHYTGAKPGIYGATMLGLTVKMQEHYATYYIGPAVISQPDTLLGSPFQIEHKLSVGWRDKQDKRIGFFIKHFSNAGLSKINYGRNFIGLEINTP